MQNLSSKDREYIWHPFTQMLTARPAITLVKGSGAKVYDEKGKEYLDGVSSWWVNLHGHSNPELAETLYKQATTMEHVMFDTFTHEPAIALCEGLLLHLPPGLRKFFFSDNGSTSTEVALKMAIQYWYNQNAPRKRVLAFTNSYHGDTFGAMSAGARNVFNAPFNPFLFEVDFIETPVPGKEKDTIYQLNQMLVKHKGEYAAFIYEPLVQGAAGMVMYQPDVLSEILELVKAEKIVCIADEVMTGFYRTGKFFASNYLSPGPDIICLSKGLTGGMMPMGLTVCTNQIYEAFYTVEGDPGIKTFFHGHSYTGNPLSCSVAVKSLEILNRTVTQENIVRICSAQADFAHELNQNFNKLANARNLGTITAVELNLKKPGYLNPLREEIYGFFLERGIVLRPLGNVIYCIPPYCIQQDELNKIHQAILDYLKKD